MILVSYIMAWSIFSAEKSALPGNVRINRNVFKYQEELVQDMSLSTFAHSGI